MYFKANYRLLLALPAFLIACKKERMPDPAFILKGLYLYDYNAQVAGKVGQPDDVLKTDSNEICPYPNPIGESLNLVFFTHQKSEVPFTYRIVHAGYPDAPDSFQASYILQNTLTYPFIVENSNREGEEVLKGTKSITADTGSRGQTFTFPMANNPKGFYRLFIETQAGEKLHFGIYKM